MINFVSVADSSEPKNTTSSSGQVLNDIDSSAIGSDVLCEHVVALIPPVPLLENIALQRQEVSCFENEYLDRCMV